MNEKKRGLELDEATESRSSNPLVSDAMAMYKACFTGPPETGDLIRMLPQLAREVERLESELDIVNGDYVWMVQKAASGDLGGPGLDGYRELGARAAAAENERDEQRRRAETLQFERNSARAIARVLAHAYTNNNTPPPSMVDEALGFAVDQTGAKS